MLRCVSQRSKQSKQSRQRISEVSREVVSLRNWTLTTAKLVRLAEEQSIYWRKDLTPWISGSLHIARDELIVTDRFMVSQITFLFCSAVTLDNLTLYPDFIVDHYCEHCVSQISGCCLIDGVGPTACIKDAKCHFLVIHVAKLSSAICVGNYSIKKW